MRTVLSFYHDMTFSTVHKNIFVIQLSDVLTEILLLPQHSTSRKARQIKICIASRELILLWRAHLKKSGCGYSTAIFSWQLLVSRARKMNNKEILQYGTYSTVQYHNILYFTVQYSPDRTVLYSNLFWLKITNKSWNMMCIALAVLAFCLSTVQYSTVCSRNSQFYCFIPFFPPIPRLSCENIQSRVNRAL